MKKFKKMNLIFGFSISKLSYMAIFMKICGKKFLTLFLGHFWLIEAKMKMKMKKFGKMSLIFEFSISKLGFVELFMKIWEKSFSNFFTWEGYTRTELSKGLTLFRPMFPFCTPWKCHKSEGFLTFSGVMEREQWSEMG